MDALRDLDWSNAPPWVALAIALVSLVLTWRSSNRSAASARTAEAALQLERDRDRARESERARAFQADQVAVWIETQQLEAPPATSRIARSARTFAGVLIHNGSPLPIYTVILRITDMDNVERDTIWRRVIPPGDTFIPWDWNKMHYPSDSEFGDTDFGVRLEFIDAGQRIWKRGETGILTLVDQQG